MDCDRVGHIALMARQEQDGKAPSTGIVRLAMSDNTAIFRRMSRRKDGELRRGWTTGTCATAATKAALARLWGGTFPREVAIRLPRGETPSFPLAHSRTDGRWAEAGIIKDAGDDPDVTHGALVIARVTASEEGLVFRAGEGVGIVTKPGLPIPPGEPAINPVPRQMIRQVIEECATAYGRNPDIEVTVSIPGGAAIARRTWNPRLGIEGGLSILGTTGIVRPFSCSAWIASIHRGIDVARASGLAHLAGCTGATSERAVQALHGLSDHAMIDMGDFAGGMLKYLRKNPVKRLTVGGGIGKITKLAQGAMDLHSSRSQVDLRRLAQEFGTPEVASAVSASHAAEIIGPELAVRISEMAWHRVSHFLEGAGIKVDVVVVSRSGEILARRQ